jgi:type II secretory pathway predicted ATPase ExeA
MSASSAKMPPFEHADGAAFYFSTPALEARREALCNAVVCGHVLLVDEEGSGKSTMLEHMGETAAPNWRVFRLRAEPQMGAKDFVHALVSNFGLPTREPAAAELRDADALLEVLTARSQIAVIFIDDAHRLACSSFDQLLYLSKRWQHYSVRFVLCADPSLMKTLEARPAGERLAGRVAEFNMPRFDREQVSDYLHLSLFHAGFEGDSPFDPGAVAMVTERTRGMVGAIAPVASELLDESVSGRWSQSGGGGARRMGAAARRWPAIMVAAAGLGLLLTLAVPDSSRSKIRIESRHQTGSFRSDITLAPSKLDERRQRRSTAADRLTP